MKKFLVQGICFNEKIVEQTYAISSTKAIQIFMDKYPFSKDVFLYEIPRIEKMLKNINLKGSKKISSIAREQFNKDDYDRASHESSFALHLNPDNREAWYLRTFSKYFLGKYEEVSIDATQEIKKNPQNEDAFDLRGRAMFFLRDYKKSIEDMDKSIFLNFDNGYAFYYRGFSKYFLKQYEAAIKDVNQAILLEPSCKNPTISFLLACSNMELESYENAIVQLNELVQVFPEFAIEHDLYYERSECLIKMEKYEEAIQDLNYSILIKPTSYKFLERGFCKLQQKIYKEAIKDFNKAEKINDDQNLWRSLLKYKSFCSAKIKKVAFKESSIARTL